MIENQNELQVKWSQHRDAKDYLVNLFDARQNIFMHGPNAVGKTTFVHDVMRMYNFERKGVFHEVYIDCVEYYSEKLISIVISKALDDAVRNTIARLFAA